MAKKRYQNNPRVIVTPQKPWMSALNSEQQIFEYMESEAEIIKSEIKDHIRDIADVKIIYLQDYDVCEYCNTQWDDDKEGAPECCGRADEEWKIQQEETSNDPK